MLRDSRSRSAHRANPGSGLAILGRPAQLTRHAFTRGTTAQHRRPHRQAVVIPGMWRRPRPQDETTQRLWPRTVVRSVGRRPVGPLHPLAQPQQALQLLLSGLGALIITSIVVLTAFFVIAEERRGPVGDSSAPPAISAESISSRDVDAAPLTRREVFGGTEIRLATGAAPYRVTVTHIDTDCGIATTGELGGVLREQGCSQVVRAGLVAPYGDYRVTAGIFNLPDADTAKAAGDDTGILVETGRGSFAAMGTGGAPAAPLTQVGWHNVGHYLLYCVISRPDGTLVTDDDPYAEQITVDLVEHYLTDDVIGQRAVNP